jgi:hypothetical protein
VLHGIVMEMWRNLQDGYAHPDGDGNGAGGAAVFPDVAELYRTAPPMECGGSRSRCSPTSTPRARSPLGRALALRGIIR